MSRSPPLRFLVLVLAGWTGIRAAWLAPEWWTGPAGADPRPRTDGAAELRTIAAAPLPGPSSPDLFARVRRIAPPSAARREPAEAATGLPASLAPRPAILVRSVLRYAPAPEGDRRDSAEPLPGAAGPAPAGRRSRWSFATWSFLRKGEATPLAAGGLLGGSQAGARIAYRLNPDRARPLALTARLTSTLRRPGAAEAALGLDWQPSSRVPIHLLGERRQRLGRDGRSAFGITLYGGVGDAPLGPLRVEAYAQAGIVGARSLDPFGDGAVRLSLPLGGRLRLGAGAWAAAQPGAARLDLGPQASLRLSLAGRSVTVAADWRQRLLWRA
jgi:hypothetical protein